METKKFKIKSSENKSRGGKNNTQTVLTAAGISAIGGAAAGVGYAAAANSKTEEGEIDKEEEINKEEINKEEENKPDNNSNNQQTNNNQTNSTTDNITEPQPTDNSNSGSAGNQNTNQNTNENTNGNVPNEDVDPDLVAQQIAQTNEIDSNDIDADDMLIVDEMQIAYAQDGSEMLVASVHTPDGGHYYLADTNGDGVFNEVFDLNGNYVGDVEANLTASDLQEMADDTGGYLAINEDEPIGLDPTGDIIMTDNESDLAQNDSELSDDEMLAMLLDGDDSNDILADNLVDDEESLTDDYMDENDEV